MGRLATLDPAAAKATGADLAAAAATLMARGGDGRITLNPGSGLNRYLVAPHPTDAIAYASSTANHISRPAFAEVQRRLAQLAPDLALDARGYDAGLERIRDRIRHALELPTSTGIVFAASGTDLEYVGLALANRADTAGIDNILLGVDEIGSGCIDSASGRFFADRTPLGLAVEAGAPIDPATTAAIRMVELPVRRSGGEPMPSEDLLLALAAAIEAAIGQGRHALVHVVHGTKTGLILPSIAHIDALRRRFGSRLSFVVDACQFRLGRAAIAAYLARGATVFVTGSKFVGGPPFSGFALVPGIAADRAGPLPGGFQHIFRRAEWPADWPGRDALPESANLGLLLRLEAAVYELELYQRLTPADLRRTLDLFDAAIDTLTARLSATRVRPSSAGEAWEVHAQPLEMRTLVTIDLSQSPSGRDFEAARTLHQLLRRDLTQETRNRHHAAAARAVHLGQPVKCVPLPGGGYAGTLRIGLSMPQMVDYSAFDSASLARRLNEDMAIVAEKIRIIDGFAPARRV